LTGVLLAVCAVQSTAADWGAASNGNVPAGAMTISEAIYAVKGKIKNKAGEVVYYPGEVGSGSTSSVIFGPDKIEWVATYEVYIPQANWCPGGNGSVPQGAVPFGNDNGPLYFIRGTDGLQGCYGVLSDDGSGSAYVYCSPTPRSVDRYEALCQCQ